MACYRSDLLTFETFLVTLAPGRKHDLELSALALSDLDTFGEWLQAQGYGNNSRRRKLLTVRKMFGFFYKRKKLNLDPVRLVATLKVERVPATLDVAALRKVALQISATTVVSSRTRVALLVLCETGCLASEVPRFSKKSLTPIGLKLVGGREGKEREVTVSAALREAILDLSAVVRSGPLLSGFNRYGPLPGPLTPRGLEMMLVELSKSPKIKALLPRGGHLTPRLIRHSVAVQWLKAGIEDRKGVV